MRIYLTGVVQDGAPRTLDSIDNPRQTLRVPRGANCTLVLRVVDAGGTPVDLAGRAVVLTVRAGAELVDRCLRLTWPSTPAGPVLETGCAEIPITAASTRRLDPGRYAYDVWLDSEPIVGTSPLLLEPTMLPEP